MANDPRPYRINGSTTLKVTEERQQFLHQTTDPRNKLVHVFGALADLGAEIANKNNFHDTIRTSIHLLLGSLGIMRGGAARYAKYENELSMLAMRGMGEEFPLSLGVCHEDERQFRQNGIYPIEVAAAKVLPFYQVYCQSIERSGIQYLVPLIIHEELMGVVFVGEKASGEAYSGHDMEVICAMARHI